MSDTTLLELPGAKIYHEVYGDGPMLLCISGADGSCEIWRMFAESLKDKFKVVLWDRRGFSRSILTDEQDYTAPHRLERDADDAAALIAKYSPAEPATVIGNSSGAIVALTLLARHSAAIKTLFCYEPPLARLLPDFEALWSVHEETYRIYRERGIHPAMRKFAELVQSDPEMVTAFLDFSKPYLWPNILYWMEREFMVYPRHAFSIDEDFPDGVREKLVLVNGEASPRGAYQFRGNVELAGRLGREGEVVMFPGEHVGHATHAVAFAGRLLEVLRERREV